MATASLLALGDDISVFAKLAAEATAGVLSDELAVNAAQVAGVRAQPELPVVWEVFKGSMLNKLIVVPAVLATSGLAPWLITPFVDGRRGLPLLGGLRKSRTDVPSAPRCNKRCNGNHQLPRSEAAQKEKSQS